MTAVSKYDFLYSDGAGLVSEKAPGSFVFRALERRISIILSDRLTQALEAVSVKRIRFV